ncbi:MAG: rhomboid family intramembrane serine protease [Acidobacteriota bacterium]
MPRRQTTGSVVCPSCGRLVGVQADRCPNCGRWNPGLWGWAPALGRFGGALSIANLIFTGCVVMLGVSLAIDLGNVRMDFPFGLLGPSGEALVTLGASGFWPLFGLGRWWTPLSAGWLHGGAVHIAFNLYYLLWLLPQCEKIFGLGRTLIIYTVSSITGFTLTSVLFGLTQPGGPLSFLPNALSGAPLTVGASASLCGLLGALLLYTQKTGQTAHSQRIWQSALFILLFGFLVSMVDNWAHIGGFVGGWLAASLLKPLEDESPLHLLVGLLCLLATGAAILLSVLSPLPG